MDRRTVIGILGASVFLGLWAFQWAEAALRWDEASELFAVDYVLYMDAARQWLADGMFYLPYQLAGPYEVTPGDVLYPPYSLILFVPFTFVPAVLWWAVPIAVTAWVVWRHRPVALTWPVLALCLWWPTTNVKLLTGNPVIWAVAALALGTLYAWPSVLVLLKPSLFPFALFGAWRRSWWVALAGLGAVSLLFLPMWPDFVAAIRNAQNPNGLAYSISEVPMLLLPVVAWLGGRLRHSQGTFMPARAPGRAVETSRGPTGDVSMDALAPVDAQRVSRTTDQRPTVARPDLDGSERTV